MGVENAKAGRGREAVRTRHANILVNIIKYNQLTHTHLIRLKASRDSPFYVFLGRSDLK